MLFTIWLLVPVLFWAAYLGLTRGRPSRHLGFPHYVIYFYLIYVGAFTVYSTEPAPNLWYLANVMLYPFLSLLGMLGATLVMGRRSLLPEIALRARPRDVKITVGALAAFLAVYALYLSWSGTASPLWTLLTSEDRDAAYVARFVVTKGYASAGLPGFLVWFPRILIDYFSIFVLVFFYYTLRGRPRAFAKLNVIVAGLLVMALETTQKYPAMKLCAALVLCVYNAKQVRLSLRSVPFVLAATVLLVWIAGAVYALVSGSYYLKLSGHGMLNGIAAIMNYGVTMLTNRAIGAETQALHMTYVMVPDYQGFFLGRTLDNPHRILPYDHVSLAYVVSDFYRTSPAGTQGASPTVFFGELYANFGHVITWICMVGFGFVMQVLNNRIVADVRHYRSPFHVAFFYMIMIYLADFSLGLNVPYFDPRVWFFVLIYWLSKQRGIRMSPAARHPGSLIARPAR